jgi:cyclic pyranopterin phosphate synthase
MTASKLRDRFRRTINYLRISVTDRCNLRCTYCMPEQGVAPLRHGEILTYEEILRVARVAVGLGIQKVRVTGGEPLVRRDILGFLERLARIEGLDDLSLTTNGFLLADMATGLKRAGLGRVNVSLDTLRPDVFERITRRPGLDRVLNGLAAARRAGLEPIKVNVVALRGINDGEILDFANFAEEGGYEVRFIEFMPAAPNSWESSRLLAASEILAVLGSRYSLQPVEVVGAEGPSRTFSLSGGIGRVGVISPMSDHFCGNCNRLRLTAEGSLRSCLFSDAETDVRRLLRSTFDDDALAGAICEAVQRKPHGHTLGEPDRHKCGLSMSKVGG